MSELTGHKKDLLEKIMLDLAEQPEEDERKNAAFNLIYHDIEKCIESTLSWWEFETQSNAQNSSCND